MEAENRRRHAGGYSIIISVTAIILVILINYAVNEIPVSLTHLDMTRNSLLTISEQTRTVLAVLEEDITIYHIAQSTGEDLNTAELLERYSELSDKIEVERIDPVLYPGFAQGYTGGELPENSLILVCGARNTWLVPDQIYVSNYTYDYDLLAYTSNTTFEGEQAITGAIDLLTGGDPPEIYELGGHGEKALPSSLTGMMEQENMHLNSLNLLTSGLVPEAADCIIINNPSSDISTDEKRAILEYLDKGGALMLLTGAGALPGQNLAEVMAQYGLLPIDGVVVDPDGGNSLSGYGYYLLPDMPGHEITDPIISGGYSILFPLAHGIEVSPVQGTEASVLAATSDIAYSKARGLASTTLQQEADDLQGKFALGCAVTQELDGGQTRIVWLASGMLTDDETDAIVSGGNFSLLLNSLGWMSEKESSVTIRGKDVMAAFLAIDSSSAALWGVLLVGVIPALFLLAGLAIWNKRRRA